MQITWTYTSCWCYRPCRDHLTTRCYQERTHRNTESQFRVFQVFCLQLCPREFPSSSVVVFFFFFCSGTGRSTPSWTSPPSMQRYYMTGESGSQRLYTVFVTAVRSRKEQMRRTGKWIFLNRPLIETDSACSCQGNT